MHQEKKMLAHISEDGTRVQTVADHLQGTAVLCGQFAAAFDAQQQGTWLGLLHDIGKYSTKFQKRLQGGEKVDHSTAGAQVAARYGQIPLAFAIAGHHSGLPDGGGRSDTAQDATMFGRLKKSVEPYTQWTNEIKLPSIPPQPEMMKENRFTQAFYTRMLYSCLVDADYLDTENFMSSPKPRGQGQTMDELLKRLNQYTAKWSHPQGTLNQRRSSILSACTTAGQTGRRGLYSLTVPTGGGKTVASLAFALSLAVKNHMDRVIYVIPYTSIIDQTADVFSEILGAENVLEHHSGVDYSAKEDDEPAAYRKALAAENWDAPVVVTTSVQFFESLYGNHASQCRKLHNIANSVVIFDEAQNLPVPYLRPCVAAIAQLVQHYRAAAVLCTATQPALQPLFDELAPGLQMTELCPHPKEQYQAFRRTTLKMRGELEQSQLGAELAAQEQVLCIVNRRKRAQELYNNLPKEGSYCLTTLLYPAHRKQLLQEIRERLKDGLPCRVISTSLIEAGVDVDFPAVYREEAGLDSILQAAGRCNREGRRPAEQSLVQIFTLEGQHVPRMLEQNVSATQSVLKKYADLASLEAIETYFLFYRTLKGDKRLDEQQILQGFEQDIEGRIFPFATAAERFRLIETPAVTVYIPQGKGEHLLARLRAGEVSKTLFRQLGQYGVPVYPDHLKTLENAGAVCQISEGIWELTDGSLYDNNTGLAMEAETGAAWFA